MTDIERWLQEAVDMLHVPMRALPATEARDLIQQAKNRFVRGDPRVWWLDLAAPCQQYDSTITSLSAILPATSGAVWFVPETEEAELRVFELQAADLERVVAECPYFEYYILGSQLDWLVAESDHNVYYVCQAR
jgi:hypothetical protein